MLFSYCHKDNQWRAFYVEATMTDDRISVQNIHLGCHYTPEPELDYSEFFSELYEYTPSSPFVNKVTEGAPSNPENCTVAFGGKGGGNPLETSTNYVRIELADTGEDSDPELSIHSDFWHTFVPDVAEIVSKVSNMAGGIKFNVFSISMDLEASLAEIVEANPELPDEFEDYDVTGFRARLLTNRFTTNANSTVATRYATESDESAPSKPGPEIGLNTSPTATPSRRAIDPTNFGVISG